MVPTLLTTIDSHKKELSHDKNSINFQPKISLDSNKAFLGPEIGPRLSKGNLTTLKGRFGSKGQLRKNGVEGMDGGV